MQVFRCERCLHVTPATALDPSVVRGTLSNNSVPHERNEQTTQFYVHHHPSGFDAAGTPRTPRSADATYAVTVRSDGEIHVTTTDEVEYGDLLGVIDYVFDTPLGDLAVDDYAGYPVLHYRRRSHPIISFEYLRRLYGVLPPSTHSVERFEVSVDDARYVVTANGNIYPVVSQDGDADLNAIVTDINDQITDRTTDVVTPYTIPHVRDSWARPVTVLHPDGEAFVRAMHTSKDDVSLTTPPLDTLSGNEQAVLVTSTVLCLLDALDDLGPSARQDVLESEAYVCRTLRRLLSDNGISIASFVGRQSVLSIPLIEQLHDLQRTVQQLKPDVAYEEHRLARGQQWRVTAPESGAPVSVRLIGRDFLSGLEQMTDKVWIGRVEHPRNSGLERDDVIPILSSQLLELEHSSPSASSDS